jgi:hypothetical protein
MYLYTMEVVSQTEDLIFRFFRAMSDDEIRDLNSAYDMAWKLDEETISEIKDAVWDLLQRRIAWKRIFDEVKDLVPSAETETEDEVEHDCGCSQSGMSDD